MRLLLLTALSLALFAEGPPATDSRNTYVPNTDTKFTAREYSSREEWESRRRHLRRQILFAAGLLPEPERGALNPQVFGRLDRDGYTIEKVLLETLPGYYLGGNLYRPKGNGPFPVVIKPHGHWAYGRLENQPLNSTQTLAVNLARMGFLVFTYDMVGYNDTGQTPHRFSDREKQLWGFGPLGLQLWNSIRVVDYVESRPDVDRSRIAATGASGGATQVFLLSAVDDRIAVSAPVNMVSSIMQGGCVCENAPGLRVGTFNVEIASMMAPRPQLLVAATGDWTKNVPREEYPAVRSVYSLYGLADEVETVQFDSPHNYHQGSRTAVYRFLAKHLLGREEAEPLEEQEADIELPSDMLALYGLPRPKNALTFEGVFKSWQDASEKQLTAMEAPMELRELMELSLKAKWPADTIHETAGDAIVLARPGVGDRVSGLWFPGNGVPALIVHPAGATAAQETSAARERIEAGRPVLLIDAFQTGSSVAPRDHSHQHFLTFNVSDDAARVQDILTALSFLHQQHPDGMELVGLDDGAIWSLFAAAVTPVPVTLTADLDEFSGSDDDFLRHFFVPGIQRAGGLRTARRLTHEGR